MSPEAGAFYYDTRNHVLVYASPEKSTSVAFPLTKSTPLAEDRDASCSLEYFRETTDR